MTKKTKNRGAKGDDVGLTDTFGSGARFLQNLVRLLKYARPQIVSCRHQVLGHTRYSTGPPVGTSNADRSATIQHPEFICIR